MVSQLSTRDLEDISSTRVRRLGEYWSSKRRPGQLFPFRQDIDAMELRDLLPLISISDVEHNPLRFRYRLVGTRVVEYNQQEFTGKYLGEVGWVDEHLLLGAYTKAVVDRRPHFGIYIWDLQTGAPGRCEFGMFPLTNDGSVIHQILAIEDYDFPSRDVDPQRI
ncbi:MAG: PAS domain-containing protein [Rhodospirillaceae bacterium]|nr:PAS domain-containing protein [Rhodospirillaceae bacterium]